MEATQRCYQVITWQNSGSSSTYFFSIYFLVLKKISWGLAKLENRLGVGEGSQTQRGETETEGQKDAVRQRQKVGVLREMGFTDPHFHMHQKHGSWTKQEKQMLRQLAFNFKCKITKLVLVMSLKYTIVTQSILCSICLMCVPIMHH